MISYLIPILVTAVGAYLLFRLRFFFILHPIRTVRQFLSAAKERDARRSLILALAGTLGVGNIFGVAAGIMIGGAGSVFWLFISSIFSMIIKYSETLLVFDSPTERGGMASAVKGIFSRTGGILSPLYAFLTVALALLMGAAMQSAAVIDVAQKTLHIEPLISAFILLILLLPCFFGNGKKIESVTEFVIPLTTIIYIFLALCVIFLNFSKIWWVIFEIVSSAFTPPSILGGTVSAAFFVAVKEGFARGILSNEAGVGTSALAHSRSRGRTPHIAGLFGICEVFFDTAVLCNLTALVILLSVEDTSAFLTPMSLVTTAFTSSLGEMSGYLLLILIFAFAYSTVICWYYYGTECASLYFPKFRVCFVPLFIAFVVFSAYIPSYFLLSVTDAVLLFMSVITLSAILKKSDRIAELSCKK